MAGIFVLNGAEFLAGVQVLSYAGATLVIILFAVMLSENITGEKPVWNVPTMLMADGHFVNCPVRLHFCPDFVLA